MHIPPSLPEKNICCWLFCTVIDNFGDIGVSWRLARLLQRELGWQVHLWLDDFDALHPLSPGLSEISTQTCIHENISLRRWQAGQSACGLDEAPTPDVVIETFACDLPPAVLHIMRQHRPLWLNWEYLSAEEWAVAMHGKPSPQADGQQKFFWLMGFDERSGGLLREADYIQADSAQLAHFRQRRLLPKKNGRTWLVFGYCSAVWTEWFNMWQQNGHPITLLLAGETVLHSLKSNHVIPQQALTQPGDDYQAGCISLHRLPFIPQNEFDYLLQQCDGLIARGEDSFVRAQYAGKPFFWHIYPQEEGAHWVKLHAFWQLAAQHFPPSLQQAHQALSDDLNGAAPLDAESRLQAWQILQAEWPAWQKSAAAWREKLFEQASSTEKLANFVRDKLK